MFPKEMLDKDGRIPAVFRGTLLRANTTDTYDRRSSEQTSESHFDDEALIQNELENLEGLRSPAEESKVPEEVSVAIAGSGTAQEQSR